MTAQGYLDHSALRGRLQDALAELEGVLSGLGAGQWGAPKPLIDAQKTYRRRLLRRRQVP